MSAGPPLPVDLRDSLSPAARALILTLQAEAAELRAKVASGHPSREDAATASTPVPFPLIHYTIAIRGLPTGMSIPNGARGLLRDRNRLDRGDRKRGWHGVFHDHPADRGGEALFFFLETPQAGVPVIQTAGGEAVQWVSAVDMICLMALILTLFA